MATWGNLTQWLSLKSKKANPYYMAIAIALCSISYLIGIWHHGSSAGAGGILLPAIPCTSESGAPKRIFHNSTAKTLDFAAHHTAENLTPVAPAARAVHFPPCDPKFSEYTPCEDTERSLKFDREMYIYRERHCPEKAEILKCRIPAPPGYRTPFRWPESRDFVWYANVPHKHLTVEKAGQNWVRFNGDRFHFPGGGTMFPRGADAYIDDIGKFINLRGGSIRTAIDTGCGVASFGAYLLSRDILTMSFAPKDTHEAQVQFALERGVPALIGIIASIRLPYPARAFDIAHCSRCLIPWGQYDGLYMMEVDRILRPGGYWILSGPPVNWQSHWKGWKRSKDELRAEEAGIENIAKSLCWRKLVQKKDMVIWQKPTNHEDCKTSRKIIKKPEFCRSQNPDRAWYTKMELCLTPLPEVSSAGDIAGGEIEKWPARLTAVPPRILSGSLAGVSPASFRGDTELWKNRISHYKLIDPRLVERGRYRNILDMNAGVGGFAAALAAAGEAVWVMNVVPVEAANDTLGVIYERGLIGTYQSWCEAMSTYPRTYDLIHGAGIFSMYEGRCAMEEIVVEMDRILRPEGGVIIRDDVDVVARVKAIADGLQWDTRMTDHEGGPLVREKLLVATKQYWTAPGRR
ncbi:probable methyltransferase PMT16 [Andrographis paniculata]|uniref:probable methyltransferase PMT16 n=1 Tax=Andrographis paniculata TaxID=175694 RepID=UPI0021E6FA4B|nr:probable methyltransferase PMT16 [Andrographis paniculata]